MPVATFPVSNQHDLIAAMAAVYAASQVAPGAYTLQLTGTVPLAGTTHLPAPAAGSSVDITGGALTGPGQLAFDGLPAGGGGRVVLAAPSTATGGIVLYGATVELATPTAAGVGVIDLQSSGPDTLIVNSGDVPGNPINLNVSNTNVYPFLATAIDLLGVVAATTVVTLDSGYGISVPLVGGGSVPLEFTADSGQGAVKFLLAPDGAGGTVITETTLAVSNGVTVLGVAGGTLDIPFDTATDGPQVQPLVDPLSGAVQAGFAIPFVASPGGTLPSVAAGQTLEVIAHAAGAYSLPTGSGAAPAAFVTDATGAVSVTGGDAGGQLVLAGTGGLTFIGGQGQGSVIAGGGNNRVSVGAGQGQGDQFIRTGGGDDTIIAFGGHDVIQPGGGSNLVMLGLRDDTVYSTGSDTIVGGPASATISATGRALTFLGAGGSSYVGTGAGTVVGNTGNDTLNSTSTSSGLFFLGSGDDQVYAGGQDTFVGGSGAASVTGDARSLIYAGTGALTFMLSSAYSNAADTVVGRAGATVTVQSSANNYSAPAVVFGLGGVDFEAAQDSRAAATVIGGTAAVTVNAGWGGGVFLGGSGGGNIMRGNTLGFYGGGVTQFIGGGNGDTLIAGNGATALQPGPGTATLVAGGGTDILTFVHGTVSTDAVSNFDITADRILLYNFPAGEVSAALGGAVIVNGNETLALSDGTHITFQGITGLTAASFI